MLDAAKRGGLVFSNGFSSLDTGVAQAEEESPCSESTDGPSNELSGGRLPKLQGLLEVLPEGAPGSGLPPSESPGDNVPRRGVQQEGVANEEAVSLPDMLSSSVGDESPAEGMRQAFSTVVSPSEGEPPSQLLSLPFTKGGGAPEPACSLVLSLPLPTSSAVGSLGAKSVRLLSAENVLSSFRVK